MESTEIASAPSTLAVSPSIASTYVFSTSPERASCATVSRVNSCPLEGTNAVILELGANDMLRGTDPSRTRQALDEIVRRLTERRIPVLLAGMRGVANLGSDYARDFETIYSELASRHGLLFYPFFLEGIAGEAGLNQGDGLHPSAGGVDAIVARILPKVEELVRRARDKRVM